MSDKLKEKNGYWLPKRKYMNHGNQVRDATLRFTSVGTR
jgi:hypothetical protein